MALFKLKRRKRESSGLFVDRSIYRYIAVSGHPWNYKVVRSAAGSLRGDFASESGSFADLGKRLDLLFESIVNDIGEIKVPINISLPITDSLMRTVSLGDMNLLDAKLAFRYEYEKYFPFPVDEAVYDMAPILYPLPNGTEEKRFIVASARRTLIDDIMNAALAQGIEIASIEPAQLALERAATPQTPFCDAAVYVYVGLSYSVIILSWKGSGIFYRSVLKGHDAAVNAESEGLPDKETLEYGFVRDINISMQFALSQIRGFEPSMMFLFGPGVSDRLCDIMKKSVTVASVTTIDPLTVHGIDFRKDDARAGSWEIPIGLALRNP